MWSKTAIIGFVLSLAVIVPGVPFAGTILGLIALQQMSRKPELIGAKLAVAAVFIGAVLGVASLLLWPFLLSYGVKNPLA